MTRRSLLWALVLVWSHACASLFQPDRLLTVHVVNAHGTAVVGASVHVQTTDNDVTQLTNGRGDVVVSVSQALTITVTVEAVGYRTALPLAVHAITEDSTVLVVLQPA